MLSQRFLHFTNSPENLLSIISYGFCLRPCKREIINWLSDRPEFSRREPQQFGMACLSTYRGILQPSRLLDRFGAFAIEMSPRWVKANFQPVTYVDRRGRSFRKLKRAFDAALIELDGVIRRRQLPGDTGFRFAYTNAEFARFLGCTRWADWLKRYEYMEPYVNRYQREWRHVQWRPYYGNMTVKEMIETPWRAGFTLRFDASDVMGVHVPRCSAESCKRLLSSSGIDVKAWPR